jgi:hypothetical protein
MAFVTADWTPGERTLRGFATACVVAFGLLGAWTLGRGGVLGLPLQPATALRVAIALWALAAACAVLRVVAPRWMRPLYVGLTAVSLPIGIVMSHVVIGLVFFGVVTPIAVAFRLVGRDPLQRTFDRSARTYWTRRAPVTDLTRYFRQF